jgi:hypothetical protein
MDETLTPPRNFSISTADQVRAAAGPPAYMRRRRHIEDLEASLREMVATAVARAGGVEALRGSARGPDAAAVAAVLSALEGSVAAVRCLRELNRLIAAHNRYYPIEANLPLDPVSRLELDRGRPYQPMPVVTLCDVFADMLAACGGRAHVGKIT